MNITLPNEWKEHSLVTEFCPYSRCCRQFPLIKLAWNFAIRIIWSLNPLWLLLTFELHAEKINLHPIKEIFSIIFISPVNDSLCKPIFLIKRWMIDLILNTMTAAFMPCTWSAAEQSTCFTLCKNTHFVCSRYPNYCELFCLCEIFITDSNSVAVAWGLMKIPH